MELYLPELVTPHPVASGAQFDTFTTKKSIDPTSVGVPVIPAGKLRPGTKLWVAAVGTFSTTGTPNITLGFWIGTRALSITTDLALSGVITTGSGAAAWPWAMEWRGMCTALGTSGTLVGSGTLKLGTSLTAFAESWIPITAALRTVTIDTTIERAIGVSGTWSASSASNGITVYDHRLLLLN